MIKIKNNQKKVNAKKMDHRDITFFLGFGLTALFLIYCLVFLPVRYETNDELTNIRRLVTQNEVVPEATSPVLSKILGQSLIFFYKKAPQVPWYGIILYTALFLGISLIYSVFLRCTNKSCIFIFTPLFMLFAFHCFAFVSFTAAALMVELGVFLSILEWVIKEKSPTKLNLLYACFLTSGLILGYMLRWELALWFAAFGFPVFLFVKKYQLKNAWPFALVLIAFIVTDRAMTYYLTSAQQKNYLAYNELRRIFHDTEKGKFHGDLTISALKKTGWTFNDFKMFKRWNLYDERLFNANTLKSFLKANQIHRTKSNLDNIPRRLKESYLKSKNYTIAFIFTILTILLFYFPVIKAKSKSVIVRRSISLGFIFSMILFFAYYRFSPRIYIPIYIFSLALVFLMMDINSLNKKVKNKTSLFQVIVSILAVFLIIFSYERILAQASNINQKLQISLLEKTVMVKTFNSLKKLMKDIDPIIVLMNPSDALAAEKVHPLKELSDYTDVFIMPSGTSINSSRYNKILKTLKLSSGSDFLKWSIDNKQILFVFIVRGRKFHMSHVQMWERYYNHRVSPGKTIKLRPAYDYRGKNKVGFLFYRMKSI